MTTDTPAPVTAATPCADPATRVTRSLAGYGVIAGPMYVVVSLVQALTRDGFDLGRHAWSQLTLGDGGWVQVANLVATGAMALAFSVALARTRGTRPAGRGGRAVPVLVGVFGLGTLLAGFLAPDPANGFPVGMPAPTAPTTHGLLHLLTSGVGFLALAAAMVVVGLGYAAEHRTRRAALSTVAAVALVGGFATISSGSAAGVPALVVGIVMAFAWLSAFGVDTYVRAGRATR